jgi:hypothetical protein
MATEIAVGTDRESQAEVDAVLAETGRTMDQVRRWRREGLLPEVVQDQQRVGIFGQSFSIALAIGNPRKS